MKAHLTDGKFAGYFVDVDEIIAGLIVEGDQHYYLKGLSQNLDLEYTVNYQTITQDLHAINASLCQQEENTLTNEDELRWYIERGLMIPGRTIKIMTGTSTGRATRNENPQAHILPYQLALMPCSGIILNWFAPASLPGVDTSNISLLVALQRGAPLLVEITKFHYLLGEILEGRYANIKQQQHVRL